MPTALPRGSHMWVSLCLRDLCQFFNPICGLQGFSRENTTCCENGWKTKQKKSSCELKTQEPCFTAGQQMLLTRLCCQKKKKKSSNTQSIQDVVQTFCVDVRGMKETLLFKLFVMHFAKCMTFFTFRYPNDISRLVNYLLILTY